MPFCLSQSARGASGAVLVATLLLSGCGPEFFKAKGTVNSDGGPLKAWSRTPVLCTRGEEEGNAAKIASFGFDLPPGFQAGRPDGKNAPEELAFAQSGNGVIGTLKVFALVKDAGNPNVFNQQPEDSYVLDSSNCKTITLDRQEQMKSFAESHKPLKGHLQLDCNVQGSHVTADLTFRHCGF